jgi:hypothetical protein
MRQSCSRSTGARPECAAARIGIDRECMEYCNGAGSDLVLAGERSAGSGGRTRRLIANLPLTTMRGPSMLSHAFSSVMGSTCRSPAMVRRRGAFPWIATRRRTSRYRYARSQRLRSCPPDPPHRGGPSSRSAYRRNRPDRFPGNLGGNVRRGLRLLCSHTVDLVALLEHVRLLLDRR